MTRLIADRALSQLLSPHLELGRDLGGLAGCPEYLGTTPSDVLMTEHNPEDNTPSLSSLSPSFSPPPSLFVFSVAQELGDVRVLLSGVAKVKQSGYSQPPHIALL